MISYELIQYIIPLAVAFLLAYSGHKWWKAGLVGAILAFILAFVVGYYEDPSTSGLLLLLVGPALLVIFPICLVENAIVAYVGAWLRKKLKR